jgi:hypothetical protein
MAEAKTKQTEASIDEYLDSRASQEQLADCKILMAMLMRVTKEQPKMWGPSIVGYGSYSYAYKGGRTGESCITGFAVRGRELVVYLVTERPEQQELLTTLGKHRIGKSCLYFKRLANVNPQVLEALVSNSVSEVRRRLATHGAA